MQRRPTLLAVSASSRRRRTTSPACSRTRSSAGQIPPGTVLRQEQLSERFAVSRTPVREALRRLAALGLVSFEPNRGVRVRSISPARAARGVPRAGGARGARDRGRDAAKMTAADLDGARRGGATVLGADAGAAASRRGAGRRESRRSSSSGCRRTTPSTTSSTASRRCRSSSGSRRRAPHVHRRPGLERPGRARRALREERAPAPRHPRAIAAGSAAGARLLAREHVLSSGRLIEAVIESSARRRTRGALDPRTRRGARARRALPCPARSGRARRPPPASRRIPPGRGGGRPTRS